MKSGLHAELHLLLPQGVSLGGGCGSSSSACGPLDLEAWVRRARPERLTVTDTHISIGASVTAFADQLALSKVPLLCMLCVRHAGLQVRTQDAHAGTPAALPCLPCPLLHGEPSGWRQQRLTMGVTMPAGAYCCRYIGGREAWCLK